MKTDIIISSKNRACQLELLLRSTRKHFKDASNIYVIYQHTSDEFFKSYALLMTMYSDVNFIKENDYCCQFKTILEKTPNNYVFFNSDDNVFVSEVKFPSHYEPDIIFSLRLGKGMNYCLPAKLEMKEPEFKEVGDILMWDWTKGDKRVCYYYPHPHDSNIYNKRKVYNLIKNTQFKNPCELEIFMNNNRDYTSPEMACFIEPKLISICNNELGQGANNVHGTQTVEFLNEQFMNGKRIRLDTIEAHYYTQCHVIQEYFFENRPTR
jgi:hypothetical protein